jgi:hypothetical protein
MLPFDGTFAGYCAAEVGNPRGTYWLPCILQSLWNKTRTRKKREWPA